MLPALLATLAPPAAAAAAATGGAAAAAAAARAARAAAEDPHLRGHYAALLGACLVLAPPAVGTEGAAKVGAAVEGERRAAPPPPRGALTASLVTRMIATQAGVGQRNPSPNPSPNPNPNPNPDPDPDRAGWTGRVRRGVGGHAPQRRLCGRGGRRGHLGAWRCIYIYTYAPYI